jgi:hypothetical protein
MKKFMSTPKGNTARNQEVFSAIKGEGKPVEYLRSYDTVVARIDYNTGLIALSEKYNCSMTTRRYVNLFTRCRNQDLDLLISSGVTKIYSQACMDTAFEREMEGKYFDFELLQYIKGAKDGNNN